MTNKGIEKEYDFSIQLLGKRIKEKRTEMNLTQVNFAKLCNISLRTLISVEQGAKLNGAYRTIYYIAKGLKIPVSELIKGT